MTIYRRWKIELKIFQRHWSYCVSSSVRFLPAKTASHSSSRYPPGLPLGMTYFGGRDGLTAQYILRKRKWHLRLTFPPIKWSAKSWRLCQTVNAIRYHLIYAPRPLWAERDRERERRFVPRQSLLTPAKITDGMRGEEREREKFAKERESRRGFFAPNKSQLPDMCEAAHDDERLHLQNIFLLFFYKYIFSHHHLHPIWAWRAVRRAVCVCWCELLCFFTGFFFCSGRNLDREIFQDLFIFFFGFHFISFEFSSLSISAPRIASFCDVRWHC